MAEEAEEKNPLSSETIEALAPVFSILCADTVSTYLRKKAEREGPTAVLPEAQKVTECMYECHDKINASECKSIMETFKTCLSKGKRVPCQPLKEALEECSVRYIRKLD